MKIGKRLLVSVGVLTLVAGINFTSSGAGEIPDTARANWHCC